MPPAALGQRIGTGTEITIGRRKLFCLNSWKSRKKRTILQSIRSGNLEPCPHRMFPLTNLLVFHTSDITTSPDAQGSTKHSVWRFYFLSPTNKHNMNTTAIKDLAAAINYIEKECAAWRIKAMAETLTRLEYTENGEGVQVVCPVEYIRLSVHQLEVDEFTFEAPTCPDMLIHQSRQYAIMDYARAMVCLINDTPAPTPEEWAEKQPEFVPVEDMAF